MRRGRRERACCCDRGVEFRVVALLLGLCLSLSPVLAGGPSHSLWGQTAPAHPQVIPTPPEVATVPHHPAAGDIPTIPTLPGDPGPGATHGDHLLLLTGNVLIGGLTGGLRQWRGDGSFRDGFVRGGLGGGLTFAGKWAAGRDIPAGGLAGRWLAATGASVTRNASEGAPTFHRLVLPMGPVRLHWGTGGEGIRASLDLFTTASLAGAYLSGIGASLDLGRSLGSGGPVVMAQDWEDDWGWHGRAFGGTVILRGDHMEDGWSHSVGVGPEEFLARALAHERVHLIQYDQAWILWGEPVEDRLLGALGVSEGVRDRLDFSIHSLVFFGLERVIPYEDQPWEWEAHRLSGTNWDWH